MSNKLVTPIVISGVGLALAFHVVGTVWVFPEFKEIILGHAATTTNSGSLNQLKSGDPAIFFSIKVVTLFVFSALGIFANILWERTSNYGKIFSLETLKPMLISPIVFYSVYLLTKELPDNVAAYLLAFQNGFFWQAIMNNKTAKIEAGDET